MNKRIIYPTDDGGVSIIIPNPGCELSTEEIAQKDVPAGKPYKIVDVAEIPEDREFRGAWEADFSEPDGKAIGPDAWFAEQEAKRQAQEDADRLAREAQELAEANNQEVTE